MKHLLSLFIIVAAQYIGAAAEPEPQVYCRFVPERKDDFFWENNYIAMRSYGPALREGIEDAGVDCWVKRVDYPIVDKWIRLFHEDQSYHIDRGEGYDPYFVDDSAGTGGTAIWMNGQREPLNTFTSWEILESTPERCEFVLMYEKEIAGDVYMEKKKISLEMNQRLFQAESTFWKNGELAVGLPIAVGLTTHDDLATIATNLKSGWAACWEIIDGYGLGTGISVPPERIAAVEIIKGAKADKQSKGHIKNKGHILLITETDEQGKILYSAGYGWERAGDILSSDIWQAYLTEYCKGS